jgi:hypothetical protein
MTASAIGLGLGLSQYLTVSGSSMPFSLSDGYYSQMSTNVLALSGSILNYVSVSTLHDNNEGDTSTAVISDALAITINLGALIVKDAGMTFNTIKFTMGYKLIGLYLACLGSNDGIIWTPLIFDSVIGGSIHIGIFSYNNWTLSKTVGTFGPYKYINLICADIGIGTQVGLSDVRIKNGSVDIGPL